MSKGRKILISFLICLLLIVSTYSFNSQDNLIKQGDDYLSQATPQKAFERYKLATFLYPFSPTPHQRLSEVFIKANDWEKARKEILVALDLATDSEILKNQLSKIDQEIKKPEQVKEQIQYWENIVASKPDYRDAWIRLSLLYYQNYQTVKAQESLVNAGKIDPNNGTIAKLKTLFHQQ